MKILLFFFILFLLPKTVYCQSYADNLACYADISVSDEISYEFRSENATDRRRESDWVTNGDRNKWIQLSWPYPVNITEIKIVNRQTGTYDPIHYSELVLSDGSVFHVGPIRTHGRRLININKEGIYWVKYLIKKGLNNVGLSEIVVFGE